MSGEKVSVWDVPVRVFHWGLVAMFATAWLTSDDAEAPHRWAGYVALGLIAFRVVWGFVGSRHARFADFVPRAAVLRDYVGKLLRGREPRHLGHNPAAAVMILFLIAMVTLIGATGWLMTTDWGWGSELLEELHEGAVNATLLAVVVHVAAAIFESVRHRENLVRAMVTGTKSGRPADGIRAAWRSVAALMLVAAVGFWSWQWSTAPVGQAATVAADRDHDDD